VKYAWIAQHKHQWPIAIACDVLQVSASGYFEHRRPKPKQAKPSSRINEPTLLAQDVRVKSQYCSLKPVRPEVSKGLHRASIPQPERRER
jgi:putative transposase